jgi:hypothetical protein
MKTKIIATLIMFAILPALITSCDKIAGSGGASIEASYPLEPMVFTYFPSQQRSGPDSLLLYQTQVNLNVDSLISKYLPEGILGNLEFDTLWISIPPDSAGNFAWLKSAHVDAASDSLFTNMLPIGNVVNDDSTSNSKLLVLSLDQTNIQPLLGEQGFWLRLYAETRGPIPYEWLTMQINSGLTVLIEPSKK